MANGYVDELLTQSSEIIGDVGDALMEKGAIEQGASAWTYAGAVRNLGSTGGGNIEFVNSIEECKDTSKQYVLPDGYIYAWKETTQEVGVDVLSAVGYYENKRINSSGIIVDANSYGSDTTNYIACKPDDIIYLKNIIVPKTYAESGRYWHTVAGYDSNRNYLAQCGLFLYAADGTPVSGYGDVLDAVTDGENIVQFTMKESYFGSNVAYFAICAKEITEISEIYVNKTSVTGYAWVNTGIKYSGSSIPEYVRQEAEETIAKANSHANLGTTLRFIAISDTHEDSEKSYNSQITVSNKHAGQAIHYIAEKINLDFIAHLGDASSQGAFTTEYSFDALCKDVKDIEDAVFSGINGAKRVYIPGNHDMMSMNNTSLLNTGAYILFGSVCSGNKNLFGGYGYFDIASKKIRVIYLNSSDSPNSAAYLTFTQSQKNWLCETLIDINSKTDANQWGILLLSHAPLDFGGANISTEILVPYVDGGSYNNYSFAGKNSAKIISNIHGHVHCFSYGYIANKIRRFTIPNACFVGNNHYGSRTEYAEWTDTTTYNKTANSGKDTSFSLVTIDLDNGMCYVDNYGAGIDREFSIDTTQPTDTNIFSLDRDYVLGTGGQRIVEVFDTNKAYLNCAYSSGVFNASYACTVSGISENSITVTEPGIGGIHVAYPVDLSSLKANTIKVSLDYSGAGKVRTYYSFVSDSGELTNPISLIWVDTAGASGSDSATFSMQGFKKIVFYFSSNTGNTKTYTNVSLEKVD